MARDDGAFEEALEFNRELGERGWIAPAWPKEYGGADVTIVEQFVFNEEFGYSGAPAPARRLRRRHDRPDAHRPRHRGAEGDATCRASPAAKCIWCQGYSEPGAGCDLASLQTRAVRDGDDYVINGQKIWTSGAPPRELDVHARPHRPGRAEAPRHHLLPRST